MRDGRQNLVSHAIEFVEVRHALLDALEEPPSESRKRRVAQLTQRKNQLLRAVTSMEGATAK